MTIFDSSCVPCILNQSLNAVNNSVPVEEEFKKRVLNEVCEKILNSKEGTAAPLLSAFIQNCDCQRTRELRNSPLTKTKCLFLFQSKMCSVAKCCGFEIGKSVIYKSNFN